MNHASGDPRLTARVALTVLFVLLFALVWSSAASAITRTGAERAFAARLADRYGGEFESAAVAWVKCPRQEMYDIDDDGYREAYCMAELGSARKRRYVSGKVDDDLTVGKLYSSHWMRRWHRCAPRYLRELRVPGRLYSNDNNCGGAALMASDLAYSLRTGHLGRHPRAYWHGTNTLGFDEIAKLRCTVHRHSRTRSIRCRNSLGDAFHYTVRR